MTGWLSNASKRQIFLALASLFIALAINILILIIPPPVLITNLLFNFRLDVAVLLIVFLALIFSRKGFAWDTISLTLTLVLFSLPLIYKWQTAGFYGYLIGGLLPWSDASGYYSGAQQLIYDGYLTSWATRRPLFGGFLAVLLSATGNDLQVTLAILAMLNGLAVFFASREIQKSHGALIAAIFLAICYLYYCPYAGTVGTEQIGLCFGAVGMVFLVRAAQNRLLKNAAFGLFLLTIALNARAGAFFILPTIALWFGINFGKELGWWKPIAIGIVVIVVGIAANFAMVKAVGSPDAVPFSNYSYTLYGLASGNKGWLQVIEDYPDVKEEEVFGLAVRKIKENPSLFLTGIIRSYRDYFTTPRGAFSFLNLVNDWKSVGGRLLWVFTWMGLASALFKRKQGQYSLMLLAFLGILLSVGLVPPIDANYMRVYAATIPFTAYIASMGIILLEQPFIKIGLSAEIPADRWNSSNLLLLLSVILLIICFVGPILITLSSHPQRISTFTSCQPTEEQISFLLGSRSSIKLVDDDSLSESYLPNIRLSDFRTGTETGTALYPYLTDMLFGLETGQTISAGVYQKNGLTDINSGYIVTNGELIKPGSYQICATISQDAELSGFFFDDSLQGNEVVKHNSSIFHQNPMLAARVRNLYGLGILLFYVFASLSYFGAWSTSSAKRLILLGGTVLIFAGILVYLHANALFFLGWERDSLNIKAATHRGGYSYDIPLGVDWMDRKDLGESPVIVYEDGIPLRYPNTPPFSVDRRGKGRFSIERGNLILSASDNSDPRNNGRHYEIYWPTPISPSTQKICYFLTVVLLLLMYSYKVNQTKVPSMRNSQEHVT